MEHRMQPQKVEVVNYKAWGDKVKAWARGTDPLPQTIAEFAAQLAAADVGMKIPSNFKHVSFVQGTTETLLVKLPCKVFMEIGEERLRQEGGDYTLPPFYDRAFETKPTINDKMAFH